MENCFKQQTYTISEISTMTGLTERTIRNYIKRGLLMGCKKSGKWIFTKEQMEQMMDAPYVNQAMAIKRQGMIDDFLVASHNTSSKVCTILDLPIEEEKARVLCNQIVQQVNQSEDKACEQMSYYYQEKEGVARFILTGKVEEIIKMMQILTSRDDT